MKYKHSDEITIGEQIAELYRAGENIGKICRTLHVSQSSVYWWLGRKGVIVRPRGPRKFNGEIKSQIAEAYAAGRSSVEVARNFGVGISTVLNAARKMGIKIRSAGRPLGVKLTPDRWRDHEARKPLLLEMAAQGATLQQVADKLGMTRERVRQLYVQYGIPRELQSGIPMEKLLAISEDWKSDMTREEIAKKYGYSCSSSLDFLRKRYHELFPPKRRANLIWDESRAKEVAGMMREHLTAKQIAARFGLDTVNFGMQIQRLRRRFPDIMPPARKRK